MDRVCGTGASDEPAVAAAAGSDPSRRASGDVPAAAGSGCFDCNICLDFAVEPVVTLCGHLYCWPCIYEWLSHDAGGAQTGGDGRIPTTTRPCPVCKEAITSDSLVPLYGRGGSRSSKKPRAGGTIPRRPTVRREREAIERQDAQSSGDGEQHHTPARSPRHAHRQAGAGAGAGAARFDIMYPPPPLGRGMNTMMHSTAGGVLGGMAVAVLPWVSRGQAPASALSAYFSSPHHLAASENLTPRLRRQHMEVERSLHQIWFFLFVFVVLCLLLF